MGDVRRMHAIVDVVRLHIRAILIAVEQYDDVSGLVEHRAGSRTVTGLLDPRLHDNLGSVRHQAEQPQVPKNVLVGSIETAGPHSAHERHRTYPPSAVGRVGRSGFDGGGALRAASATTARIFTRPPAPQSCVIRCQSPVTKATIGPPYFKPVGVTGPRLGKHAQSVCRLVSSTGPST